MTPLTPWIGETGPRFVDRPAHRDWLMAQAMGLLDFFQPASLNPRGGFFVLDTQGRPLVDAQTGAGSLRQLHETCRMIHCSAIAHQLGYPGADLMVDHGMDFLWTRHRDTDRGGYFWGVDDNGPVNDTKQAYGHAFVLLAASSARVIGHPGADRLLADITEVLNTRFWDADAGVTTEEYAADWSSLGDYRGQNSNMHLTEALMAAYEATGTDAYLDKAVSIASLIIDRHARSEGWRVAEHFTASWQIDRDYSGDPMFRPHGTTPGHALEWSRLLVQLWELGARRHDWMLDAARNLFLKTTQIGWAPDTGGFYYTLDWNDAPAQTDRFWWPCAEGIGAAAALASVDDDPQFEHWYRRIWSVVNTRFIDHDAGGWHPELDAQMRPAPRVFSGKPDLYHSFQACLIPLLPADGSITRGLARGLDSSPRG